MALNSNFVFTNPVAAQQYVQMQAQEQAQREARDRAMAATMEAIGRQRISSNNLAAQREQLRSQQELERERIRTQQQMDKDRLAAQAAENEKGRTARAAEVKAITTYNADTAAKDKGERAAAASEVETYNFIQSQIAGGDPPTDSEFEEQTAGMSPARKNRLDALRKSAVKQLDDQATWAEQQVKLWNNRLKALADPNNKSGKTMDQIVDEFAKSPAGKVGAFDPATMQFYPLAKRARVDSIESLKGKSRGASSRAPGAGEAAAPDIQEEGSGPGRILGVSDIVGPAPRSSGIGMGDRLRIDGGDSLPQPPPMDFMSVDMPGPTARRGVTVPRMFDISKELVQPGTQWPDMEEGTGPSAILNVNDLVPPRQMQAPVIGFDVNRELVPQGVQWPGMEEGTGPSAILNVNDLVPPRQMQAPVIGFDVNRELVPQGVQWPGMEEGTGPSAVLNMGDLLRGAAPQPSQMGLIRAMRAMDMLGARGYPVGRQAPEPQTNGFNIRNELTPEGVQWPGMFDGTLPRLPFISVDQLPRLRY